MNITSELSTRAATELSGPGARHLARGITATWWYTLTAVIFFEVMLGFVWIAALSNSDIDVWMLSLIGLAGVAWFVSTIFLLLEYRYREDAAPGFDWRRLLVPLLVAVVFGAIAVAATGSWLLASFALTQSLVLLNWSRGVRYRVVLTLTALLVALWFFDSRVAFGADGVIEVSPALWMAAGYSVFLPVATVTSLWWWDVLNALDRARASEVRLATTQERLRVATDVHDLQGHHLQVIALQLELAERLMDADSDAALEQLRAARASVDEARQGTRDLATRFRSVPLRDELANASDLLRAAGLQVETTISDDVDRAPASDLGPVIRETTTNVLRHGGGEYARLSLGRTAQGWRYEIANDAAPGAAVDSASSGLQGIERRIGEAGGTCEVQRGQEFVVIVTVPSTAENVGAR